MSARLPAAGNHYQRTIADWEEELACAAWNGEYCGVSVVDAPPGLRIADERSEMIHYASRFRVASLTRRPMLRSVGGVVDSAIALLMAGVGLVKNGSYLHLLTLNHPRAAACLAPTPTLPRPLAYSASVTPPRFEFGIKQGLVDLAEVSWWQEERGPITPSLRCHKKLHHFGKLIGAPILFFAMFPRKRDSRIYFGLWGPAAVSSATTGFQVAGRWGCTRMNPKSATQTRADQEAHG
ncbi:hypothetical protein B0H16DRAFT_1466689 [Mycena metata]|uniref:Uncharacterized protein n=1 Tax=Mycena metata TaxID=1033252 RepID=A0AAD7I7W5_9AGAR|nr:hypothetical protein B0H16DRAFT_1466689 [Mycena metata]